MSSGALRDLIFALQALRRTVERHACCLGGALGVAADLYPHQIANVARILADTEVRHLLADEVGLGKTVQALMVLNALRLQFPQLKAAILVPDTLMVQWRDELRGRAHVAPDDDQTLGLGDRDVDSQRPILLWPERLREVSRVTELLRSYDLVIVDELQLFEERVQRQIVAAAPDIRHVLLLTATPGLTNPRQLDKVFRILEPQRAAAAGDDPGQVFDLLRARETAVVQSFASGDWSVFGPPPSHTPRMSAALAHSAVRRIIRTRRDAWRGLMPYREPAVSLVEPVDAEVERQRLMWRYFSHLKDLTREFDLPQLAQRVVRSPASLRQRVTYLRGHGHEREGLLQQVQAFLTPEQGDSRFDELCDVLSGIWAHEASSRVLVCAGDNLTVDDLERRLPRLFDFMPASGEPLRIATLRNQSRGPDALVPTDDQIAQAVRSFRSGESQMLIAAEVGSSGLNLQCTRHLVLYSVPWDPSEIEQWVGRIDRIGNTAIGEVGTADVKPISIHVIAQKGLVDERVVEIIQATTILRRSISLDPNRVEEVSESIRAVALANRGDDWRDLRARAQALGAVQDVEELALPLTPDLPWTTERAVALSSRLTGGPPVFPALGGSRSSGVRARERAALEWLLALNDAKEYEIRRHDTVTSLGYVDFFGGRPRHVSDVARKPLDESLIPHPRARVYFHLRRDQLEQPPRTVYIRGENGERPQRHHLYFFDHGSPVHENLLGVWLRDRPTANTRFKLEVPSEHPLSAHRGDLLVIDISVLDPQRLLAEQGQHEAVQTLHGAAADLRFISHLLPAAIIVAGRAFSQSRPSGPVCDDITACLIAPPRDSKLWALPALPWTDLPWLTRETQKAVALDVARDVRSRAEAAWAPLAEGFRRAVEDRCYVLNVEANDRGESEAGPMRLRSRRLGNTVPVSAAKAISPWTRLWCLVK